MAEALGCLLALRPEHRFGSDQPAGVDTHAARATSMQATRCPDEGTAHEKRSWHLPAFTAGRSRRIYPYLVLSICLYVCLSVCLILSDLI